MKDGPANTDDFWKRSIVTSAAETRLPGPQARSHCNEKIYERIEGYMQNQLAEFKLGRIALHLLCSCQDKNFPWHWRGIVRELSQGAMLVSPPQSAMRPRDGVIIRVLEKAATMVRRHRSAGNDAIPGTLRPFTD